MARTSINVEEMMKDPSYQNEYDSYIKFIRNFVKLFINRCNIGAKTQYDLKKQNLIKMMQEKYTAEYNKRVVDNKENRLFLEELLNHLEDNMDSIFDEELSSVVFNKNSSGISLNAMNNFRGLNELDADFAILRKKTCSHLPYYDFARLDSFYNSLRNLSAYKFRKVCDMFLSKTVNRFLILAPYTSNYLVNNQVKADKYIAEFNSYLAFINNEAKTFVLSNGKDARKQYRSQKQELLADIINRYTSDFIKRWVKKVDEMFLWELVNGISLLFEEFAKHHYDGIMSEMSLSQAAYYDKALQRSEYTKNSMQINRTKRNVRRSL